MSKLSLIVLLIMVCLTACKKTADDDISGTAEMNGKLYVENIYESETAKLLAAHEVFLLKDTSAAATSFFFSTKSDNNGFFSTEYLYPDNFYRVHAEKRFKTKQDTSVLFTADTVLRPAKQVSVVLRPDMKKQNALYLLCTDDRVPAGRIPNVKIYIYASRVLAELNSADITPSTGHSYELNSQLDGTAFKINLPQDSLFVNAIITIGTTKLKCIAQGLNRMEPAGVVRDTIVLR